MIDHSRCEHERTSRARAACRKARANGEAVPQGGASVKEVDFKGSGGAQGSTPRDKDRACVVCGVEPFTARGRDLLNECMLYVGEKCFYMIQNDPDLQLWDAKERCWIT